METFCTLLYVYFFLNLGSWNETNRPCEYEKPSRAISRKSVSLILSLSDVVFLDFIGLLKRKHSRGVKENIKK